MELETSSNLLLILVISKNISLKFLSILLTVIKGYLF